MNSRENKWVAHRQPIRKARSERVFITRSGDTLSFADAIAGWRDDEDFRAFFIAELAATEFPAFFWEMPPVRREDVDIDYEYVAIRSDGLDRMRPDARAFESQLRAAGSSHSVVSFRNLGGDAILVAPKKISGLECYGHIAAFVRSAPIGQRHELLRNLGRAVSGVLGESDLRVWVSTSGLGVPWVHIRLDSYPKYYNHEPYAKL
jgi:acetyl esterase/lipase